MGTKAIVVLVLWVVAIVLFGLTAAFVPDSIKFETGFRMVAAGLGFTVAGFAINEFWNPTAAG